MVLQYDDMVLQVVERLRKVIPQGTTTPTVTPKIAEVIVMDNAQKQIENFFNSQEQSKIMVTYSGNNAEGGREAKDFVKTIGETMQEEGHTIEVHICAKKYMWEQMGDKPGNTMLRLMWAVRAGLVGLKMYSRDNTGKVNFGDPMEELTGGMFSVETFFDRNHPPGTVAVCRFQLMEFVPPVEDVDPADIWGQYKEFTFEEYGQQNGSTPSVAGTPTSEVVYEP